MTFAIKTRHMSIRSWVQDKAVHGFNTFSTAEARKEFPAMSTQLVKTELGNLVRKKAIASVYRGFYVIIPTHYALRGSVPPTYYIDHLMRYLGKPYYVSLMSAAELSGAAHQRPQRFSVTTQLPRSRVSTGKNPFLVWSYRRDIDSELLWEKNTETGTLKYSSPELTALDLIQYSRSIGGLPRAATVLEELIEAMDARRFTQRLCDYATRATLQRLGFVLEKVLSEQEMADAVFCRMKASGRKLPYVPLDRGGSKKATAIDKRWKITINCEIEPEDLR